ncbi:MAG: co-chaperone GroES [Candidatus Microgenomates bacterium]|jgi:chaperonin GroES
MAKKISVKTNKLNLAPTPGYLVILPLEAQTKTASGIYLPDSATGEKPQKGKVLAVGADEVTETGKLKKTPCKVGDTVIYKKWGGNEVKIDGVEYLFSKFEDVLAVEI